MMERRHGVERVREACSAGVQACYPLAVAGIGVAEGDSNAFVGESLDEMRQTVELWSYSDQLESDRIVCSRAIDFMGRS